MSSSSRDRRILALCCAPISVVVTMPATGQTVPRLEVDAAVLLSENPLLIPGRDRQAAQVDLTVRPGIALTTATGSTFDLGGVLTERVYSRRYGRILIGRVDATATYRDSEFLSVGGSAAFARDSAIDLLTSSVEAVADPLSIRTNAVGRVFVRYQPDALTTIIPDMRYERTSYTRSPLLGSTRAFTTGIAYRRRFDARRTLGLRAGWGSSEGSRLTKFSTQLLYVTVDQQLSPGWRLTGELGAERIGGRTETLAGTTVRQPAGTRFNGRFDLCRIAPGPALCLGGLLSSEVSGLGGLQRRAVVTASANQRLGERTMLRTTAEYQRTQTRGTLFPPFDAIRAVAEVERSVSRRIAVTGTLQYLRRRLVEGDRVGATYAGFRLTYTPELR